MNNAAIKFISVDGHGGSGKSSFAKKLAVNLGAEIIHIDDFTGTGASTEWYRVLIDRVVEPALSGASSLSYSRAKWWPSHNPEPVVNQAVTNIIQN